MTESGEHASDADEILTLEGVRVAFGGVEALRIERLGIMAGEIAAVVGPNGAGKTTLLNALGGVLHGVDGSIRFRGLEIVRKSPSDLARLRFGRSFQDPKLVESATALDNVLAGRFLSIGYSTWHQLLRPGLVRAAERRARDEALELLDRFGLHDSANSVVTDLSFGSRKLIDIARAVAAKPEVLMLDEPSSGVAPTDRRAIAEVIGDLASTSTSTMTIIVVEHHMDLVRSVADRVVGMKAGQIIAVGPPGDVLDSSSFRAALVGQ